MSENEHFPLTADQQNLANSIAWQANGIVSKQLLKNPNGNVTLFAFDKGESLSEHTAPFEAMVQVIEGKLAITIAGHAHEVSGGEFIIMPANIPHGLVATEKTKMLLTMIK